MCLKKIRRHNWDKDIWKDRTKIEPKIIGYSHWFEVPIVSGYRV